MRRSQEGKLLSVCLSALETSMCCCVATENSRDVTWLKCSWFAFEFAFENKPLHFTQNAHYEGRCSYFVLLRLASWFVRTACHCCREQPHMQHRVTEGPKSSNPFNSRESKEGSKSSSRPGVFTTDTKLDMLKMFIFLVVLYFKSYSPQLTMF